MSDELKAATEALVFADAAVEDHRRDHTTVTAECSVCAKAAVQFVRDHARTILAALREREQAIAAERERLLTDTHHILTTMITNSDICQCGGVLNLAADTICAAIRARLLGEGGDHVHS